MNRGMVIQSMAEISQQRDRLEKLGGHSLLASMQTAQTAIESAASGLQEVIQLLYATQDSGRLLYACAKLDILTDRLAKVATLPRMVPMNPHILRVRTALRAILQRLAKEARP